MTALVAVIAFLVGWLARSIRTQRGRLGPPKVLNLAEPLSHCRCLDDTEGLTID